LARGEPMHILGVKDKKKKLLPLWSLYYLRLRNSTCKKQHTQRLSVVSIIYDVSSVVRQLDYSS
jgi:hypothetical protein